MPSQRPRVVDRRAIEIDVSLQPFPVEPHVVGHTGSRIFAATQISLETPCDELEVSIEQACDSTIGLSRLRQQAVVPGEVEAGDQHVRHLAAMQ